MALTDNSWYTDSVNYAAVTAWSTGATIAAGALRRQLATPSVNNERVFVCVVAGTTHASTEPTWTLTRGAITTDNTVSWQECTGIAALNGDAVATPNWTSIKNTAITLGQVIKRDSEASYHICTVAGTAGNGAEPSFSDTAGTTLTDNGVTWTSLGVVGGFTPFLAPHARLANAFTATWGAAGNRFYIASSHAETQAATMNLNPPGTIASPNYIFVTDKLASPPLSANLASGATITTTGAFAINLGNSTTAYSTSYWYASAQNGLIFNSASGAVSVNMGVFSTSWGGAMYFKNASFRMPGTSGGTMRVGGQANTNGYWGMVWDGCTVSFGVASQGISVQQCRLRWINAPSAVLGTVPTNLFKNFTNNISDVEILGVDLSALGSGNTIVAAHTSSSKFAIRRSKLGASVTPAATPSSQGSAPVDFENCDSGATLTRNERYAYQGTETTELTIVRSGGAAAAGTSVARKIITTANALLAFPFEAFPLAIWNPRTATNVVVTVYGIWGGGAVPNNDEIWMEVEYAGSSATPVSSFVTSGKADFLASASAVGSDGSSWGGSTTAFKLTVTLSAPQPGLQGYILAKVRAAKASATFYIDPKIALS